MDEARKPALPIEQAVLVQEHLRICLDPEFRCSLVTDD